MADSVVPLTAVSAVRVVLIPDWSDQSLGIRTLVTAPAIDPPTLNFSTRAALVKQNILEPAGVLSINKAFIDFHPNLGP